MSTSNLERLKPANPLGKIFSINSEELRTVLKNNLEEIPGSELCCGNYILAIDNGNKRITKLKLYTM